MLHRVLGFVLLSAMSTLTLAAETTTADSSGFIPLFDGKTLNDWKASENPDSFRAADGQIAADGPRAHLFYTGPVQGGDFRNFELQVEVLTRPGANSGVYFHSEFLPYGWPKKGFEVQVNNSYQGGGGYRELKMTGSLYGLRNQYKTIVKDNEWFTMHVTVRGKRVQVKVNEKLLVDYREPDNAAAGNLPQRLGHGTFALQCHDPQSKVFYRNIRVKPLPDVLPDEKLAVKFDEVDWEIVRLQQQNFPVVDFHVHLKGGLTLEEALAGSRQKGINYGIAVNCGVGFPVTNDRAAEAFFQGIAGQPVFIGMQAEGREWPKLFSKETIAKFDYVFTDGMTIVDHRGRRARLWMKDEVDIPDKQAFMELLVRTIVGILNDEPIDIYVNPTYLPGVIAKEYDQLWTQERTQKIIDAAAANGVAIEINSNLRLPKADFIRRAKRAGVKFTFGTNNGGRELGRLEYSLEMARECGLTWQDMWLPKLDGQKPVQVRKR